MDTNNNVADFRRSLPATPHNGSSPCLAAGQHLAITTARVAGLAVEQGSVLTVFGNVTPGTVPAEHRRPGQPAI